MGYKSFLWGIVTLFFVQGTFDLSFHEAFSFGIFVFFLLQFIDSIGNRLAVNDITILLAIFTCLIMPVFGYEVYHRGNPLSYLWRAFMRVDEDVYYSYMIPATLALAAGIRFPIRLKGVSANTIEYLDAAKAVLVNKSQTGILLVITGFVFGIVSPFVPESIKYITYLFAHLMYVGVFYVVYSPYKNKRTVLFMVFSALLLEALIGGMFGELLYMSILSSMLLLLGIKISFRIKFLVVIAGIYMVLLIQAVKRDYRAVIWSGETATETSAIGLFGSLILEKVVNPSQLVEPNKMFFIYTRFNQGGLVSKTLHKVPEYIPYANGETIYTSLLATFIPRIFWPDKPKAGGYYNIKRFLGFELQGYSMNIGPFGEAYGNFGVQGGIIYMFFYGLFFNWILQLVFKFCNKRPTFVLWIPLLFFYTLGVETDTFTTVNSVVKVLVFAWFIYYAFRKWLKMPI